MAFKPALIVNDMQNDCCHPEYGSVVVPGGALDLVGPINSLLAMKGFAFKLATMNAHPVDHKCFAHNHEDAIPYETHIDLPNTKPGFEHETVKQKLWPKCCQVGTKGHQLVDGIDESAFDMVLTKNQHPDVTHYSAFKDVHGNHKHHQPAGAVSHHLEEELACRGITHVYCVGTAGDLCVCHTAIDAADAGFKAYVIEDVTKSFDAGEGWKSAKAACRAKGVGVVMMNSPEVKRVTELGAPGQQGEKGVTMVFNGHFNGPVFFGYSPKQVGSFMEQLA